MPNLSREEQLRAHVALTARRLSRAGAHLASRQVPTGPLRGNVPPWGGSEDPDFHGTLSAIWLWSRAAGVGQEDGFAASIASAWAFVRGAWPRFVPKALGPSAGDEAAYDCAMVLRAALGDPNTIERAEVRQLAEIAARLLAAYLTDLDDLGGRGFADPGFLAWNLAEYARAANDRGMQAAARRFVERAFGMKPPPPFEKEGVMTDGLFDFSSTTAMRVMAVLAVEGNTPFVGAWLRERVAPVVPQSFVERPLDENCWNACVAACLGRAYVVATDPAFLQAHQALVAELDGRLDPRTGTLGRERGREDETLATFHYALAMDAMVKGAP